MGDEMDSGQVTVRNKNGLSPTREIYNRLKPYWKSKKLNDQDWAVVLVCLRRIEKRCATCPLGKKTLMKSRHHLPSKAVV
jgi:hypothetical protein